MSPLSKRRFFLSFTLAAIAVTLVFAIEGFIGFSLADEGFLWYGAQRVSFGEVPIRDFTSYEPGRYFWVALWNYALNDVGIMSTRIALYAFWLLGIMAGILLCDTPRRRSATMRIIDIGLFLVLLMLWGHPRHKLFDISISIFLVAGLAWVLNHPSLRRFFLAGVFLGLAAFFGRNHALYGGIGYTMAFSLCRRTFRHRPLPQVALTFFLGITVGFFPLFLMMMIFPGFLAAHVESTLAILRLKQTNLPLPVPWPWLIDVNALLTLNTLRELGIGLLFVSLLGIPLVYFLFVALKSRQDTTYTDSTWRNSSMVAAACMAIPYAHHGFSRADLSHLAQAFHPGLILAVLLTLKMGRGKYPCFLLMTGLSCLVSLRAHPYLQCFPEYKCVTSKVSGHSLFVRKESAHAIEILRTVYAAHGKTDRTFLIAPFWPGAYALFQKKSPMLWTFPLFAQTPAAQYAEIGRIAEAEPSFALLSDYPLDGLDSLRFSSTNSLIFKYLNDTYVSKKLPEDTTLTLYLPKTQLQ